LNNKILIVLIIAFAIAIRTINIGKYGLGGDEKYTIMVMHGISWEGATQKEVFQQKYFTAEQFWASLTFADFDEAIIRTDNGNSAAYYGFMYLWGKIVGISDANLRFLGVIFDCLTILLLFLFGKNILEKTAIGLLAAAVAAIEPFLIAYSHQIRNYPAGIFFTLLSFYLFFKILKQSHTSLPKAKLLIFYALSLVLAVLCHFYTALFTATQGLIFLVFYAKNIALIKKMLLPYTFVIAIVAWWFSFGSGRDTFATLKYKDEIFEKVAQNTAKSNNLRGWVEPATAANLLVKLNPIVADSFLLTNGISEKISGKLNFAICIFLSLLLWGFYRKTIANSWAGANVKWYIATLLVIVAGFLLFNVAKLYFVYVAIVLLMFYEAMYAIYVSDNKYINLFFYLALLCFALPVGISVLGAIKAGHTANIYQKYLSYGMPIFMLFTAMAWYYIWQKHNALSYLYCILPVLYLLSNVSIWKDTLLDNYPKYTIFAGNRVANPYPIIAEQIIKLAQPGDTVIYPSYTGSTLREYDKNMQHSKSIIDAQLTNIYLPKTLSIPQRVNAAEPNKVLYYQKSTGKYLQLFDFQGIKYRY
jgi:uncharacterized membrane protein